MRSEQGPPMTLENAAAAHVRLIVWCKACGHQVEPDPAEMAGKHGADSLPSDHFTSGRQNLRLKFGQFGC
jgi:hypothetical protein